MSVPRPPLSQAQKNRKRKLQAKRSAERKRLVELGHSPSEVEEIMRQLQERHQNELRGESSESVKPIESRYWANRTGGDSAYRPEHIMNELRGQARAVGASAKALKSWRALTKAEHEEITR